MGFDTKEIKHIAELSRLKLSKEEEKKYGEQISSVLEYVKMLDEIKAKDLNNSSLSLSGGVTDLENVWRDDDSKMWNEEEVKNCLEQGEIEDGFVKVKRVL